MKRILFLSTIFIAAFFLADQVSALTPIGGTCYLDSECESGFCRFANIYFGKCCQSFDFCCGDQECYGDETCSNCPADCGSCLKPNGSGCSSDSECQSGKCVHGVCRSLWVYCGDSYCDFGESCSSCSSDCGSCLKSNGSSCSSASECTGGYCVNSYCRSSSTYCGDSHCDSGENCSSCSSDCGSCGPVCGNGSCESAENCSNCSSDCGSCTPVLKSHGSYCTATAECVGYCVHGICRPENPYCGDNYCDDSETCSFCSSDCGVCQTAKKVDGEYCDKNEECTSGNCQNYRCCLKGKTCCLSTNNCPLRYYCSEERHYCLSGKPNAQSCTANEQCESGNCQNDICCGWGQTCCQKKADCKEGEYCENEKNYCRYQWQIGERCQNSEMCKSDYCDSDSWKCAEKSSGAAEEKEEEPVPATPTAAAQEEAIVISSGDLFLKTYETHELSIDIQNKSQKEIILGDYLLIENPIPVSIDIQKSALQIFKKTLLPGEIISTEGWDGQRETIEKATFTSLRQGSGAIKLKVVYFVDNRAKWSEDEVAVSVSASYTQKEEAASQIFNETMLWAGREVDYADNEKEYIFVSVEDKSLQEAAINDWQADYNQMKEAVTSLKDDFTGVVKPEILSFFETIKSLEEAKSFQEITEASIRALAPPSMVAGFDFANLLDAIDRQKKLERGLLTHFDATDFVTVPIYDSQRNVTGYTKTIVKEKDGKFYAIKIGNL